MSLVTIYPVEQSHMVSSIIILILQMKNPRNRSCTILPKVTWLVSGGDET